MIKRFLIAIVALIIMIIMICGIRDDYYIIDKGYALNYVDEYGLTHDDVFWFVLGSNDTKLVLFVSPYLWYAYSIGEKYVGSVRAGIIYEGDDNIARYLKDMNMH